MEFAALILFLVFYQLKPQEWFPWMADLRPVQVIMAAGLFGLLSRERPLRLKDLFRTPHDWLVMAYIGWIVVISPTPFQEFKDFQVHIVTYFVTVHALTNVQRMQKLFFWWSMILMTVAALAVLSTMGFDPLDSYQQTMFRMKGRLVLNLSIYDNPNTLAHTIVPVLPMLFFVMFWKRLLAKALIVIMGLPLYCIFLTESKGAFISCFGTLIAILTFGRPKLIQVLILVVAFSSGIGALYLLPRMTELNKAKSDPAIQGRVEALKFGMRSMNMNFTGIGPGLFVPKFIKEHHYQKAAHNSYNQNGAELGRPGLWLFLALLYACGRTLLQAKTANTNEERIRRILFTILVAYVLSSWMVDFAYRTAFFVMIGATGAFHRLVSGINEEIAEEIAKDESEGVLSSFAKQGQSAAATRGPGSDEAMQIPLLRPVPMGRSAPVALPAVEPIQVRPIPRPPPEPEPEPEGDETEGPHSLTWARFGIIDIAATFVILKLVERFWIHLINTM